MATILLLTNGLSAFGLMVLLRYLYGSFPALAMREHKDNKIAPSHTEINDDLDSIATDSPHSSSCSCLVRVLGLEEFAASGCALVMVAYAFLFMTVLSFGSLMTVYLRYAGMPDSHIGEFSMVACMGMDVYSCVCVCMCLRVCVRCDVFMCMCMLLYLQGSGILANHIETYAYTCTYTYIYTYTHILYT
ncbi:hypothetical protein EON65_33930, partial [archaeon]